MRTVVILTGAVTKLSVKLAVVKLLDFCSLQHSSFTSTAGETHSKMHSSRFSKLRRTVITLAGRVFLGMLHFDVLSKFHYHIWSLTGHWCQDHTVAAANAADEVAAQAEAGEVRVELERLKFWFIDH